MRRSVPTVCRRARWPPPPAGVGADVHLVDIVSREEDAEGAIRYLESVSRRHRAAGWDVFQRNDVGEALADTVAGFPAGMACLATHGRDRSASLLGSVGWMW